jgi:hypothetical protein
MASERQFVVAVETLRERGDEEAKRQSIPVGCAPATGDAGGRIPRRPRRSRIVSPNERRRASFNFLNFVTFGDWFCRFSADARRASAPAALIKGDSWARDL